MSKLLICVFIRIVVLSSVFFLTTIRAVEIEGSSSGRFINPTPESAVVAGVGTDSFAWGDPGNFGTGPSRFTFEMSSFATDFKKVFSVGVLHYFNGITLQGTDATTVELEINITLTIPPGVSKQFTKTLHLINTPNISTPEQNADSVFLPTSFPKETFKVDGVDYTLSLIGFGNISGEGFAKTIDKFQVLEEGTASAELLGIISPACVVSSGIPPYEQITNFGSCPSWFPPFTGLRAPTWGRFGSRQILEAKSGEKLEIECSQTELHGQSILAYQMFYTAPGRDRLRVGICPFQGGCNTAVFFYSGDDIDDNGNHRPVCFIQTQWTSRDYSWNDTDYGQNPWTEEPKNSEHYLDWAQIIYNVSTNNLLKEDQKYEYTYYVPLVGLFPAACSGPYNFLNPKPEGENVGQMPVGDPPLGPETESFFDQVLERLGQLPPSEIPMEEDAAAPCDFNRDGHCDAIDLQLFKSALGTCRDDVSYDIQADFDGSGCVDKVDQQYLFGPIANAGPNQTVRLGSLVTLNGSASSDPDQGPSPLSFVWTQTAGPAVTLTGVNSVKPTFTPTVKGAYTFSLTVNDGQDNSAPSVVIITVPTLGDIDLDGDVDNNDLNLILAARNTKANSPNDLRDLDGDDMITALDARKLVLLCTRPRCATQ